MDAAFTTTIRNITSRQLTLGFLPKSKDLAAGEELVLQGDLVAQLSLLNDKRKLEALSRAVTGLNRDGSAGEKKIALVRTPAVHCFDVGLDMTKVVNVVNGSVVAQNPSWGNYSSSI